MRSPQVSLIQTVVRVFIFWLEDEAALSLSPLDVSDTAKVAARPIRHFLRQVSDVPSESQMPGDFVSTTSSEDSEYGAHIIDGMAGLQGTGTL